MAFKLSEKLKNLTPYTPLEGNFDIRLDANESFISLPQEVLDEAIKEFDIDKINRYPDPYTKDLCEAFGKHYKVHPDYVVAGNGSDELIGVIISGFFQPDDHVLTLSHDFSMYKFYCEIYGIKNSVFEKDPDSLEVNIPELIDYINENDIKGLIFSNPCNPTSLCIPKDQIYHLIRNIDALVILDEAYMDFTDASCLNRVDQFDNLIILRTCSKALGLASIRLGFSVANFTLTKIIRSLKAPYNVNSLTQIIGRKVYSKPVHLYECHARIIRARDHLKRNLMNLEDSLITKLYNSSANFVFMKTEHSPQIHKRLMDRSIAIRLMGDFLRVTVGTIQENEAFMNAFVEVCEEIKKIERYRKLEEENGGK